MSESGQYHVDSGLGSLQMVSEPRTALFSGGEVCYACGSPVEGRWV